MLHDVEIQSRYRALHVLQMLRPHKLEGSKKIRVGRMFDGGYVMLDRFEGVSAVYSLGINDDTSFDMDFARRDIPVYQYDHTIERLPASHDLFHWHKTAIGGVVDDAANAITLAEAITRGRVHPIGRALPHAAGYAVPQRQGRFIPRLLRLQLARLPNGPRCWKLSRSRHPPVIHKAPP